MSEEGKAADNQNDLFAEPPTTDIRHPSESMTSQVSSDNEVYRTAETPTRAEI